MGHANVMNNTLVDDNGMEIDDLSFAGHAQSKFADQIKLLESQRRDVPPGWHPVFNDMIRMLRAVDCSKRDGIEFSEPAVGRGSLRIQVYDALTDKVVRGIINKMAARTECTCEHCGRGHGAVYRLSSEKTLCAGCHVRTDLKDNVALWLGEDYQSRKYRESPVMEFDSLPWSVQRMVPMHKIKKLHLASLEQPVQYVTPADVLTQLRKMKVIKRFLDQPGAA